MVFLKKGEMLVILRLNKQLLMMSFGLLPLAYMLVFSTPKYIVGWGVGTYPLIVVAFVAGMQFQRTSNTWVQILSLVYPLLISYAVLVYGDAPRIYAIGMLVGLGIDGILLLMKKISVGFCVVRIGLTVGFIAMIFTLSHISIGQIWV
jgi:hypothetical protein